MINHSKTGQDIKDKPLRQEIIIHNPYELFDVDKSFYLKYKNNKKGLDNLTKQSKPSEIFYMSPAEDTTGIMMYLELDESFYTGGDNTFFEPPKRFSDDSIILLKGSVDYKNYTESYLKKKETNDKLLKRIHIVDNLVCELHWNKFPEIISAVKHMLDADIGLTEQYIPEGLNKFMIGLDKKILTKPNFFLSVEGKNIAARSPKQIMYIGTPFYFNEINSNLNNELSMASRIFNTLHLFMEQLYDEHMINEAVDGKLDETELYNYTVSALESIISEYNSKTESCKELEDIELDDSLKKALYGELKSQDIFGLDLLNAYLKRQLKQMDYEIKKKQGIDLRRPN